MIRPLDWIVISDHAENLGLAPMIAEANPDLLELEWGKRFYDLNKDPIVSPYTGEVVQLDVGKTRMIAADNADAATVKAKEAETVEVTKEAEDAWVDLLLSGTRATMMGAGDCTPGYYNNEGKDRGEEAKYNVGYPHGPTAYFQYIDEWRKKGDFDGLAFG